jgi:hypothetical protein
MQPGATEQCTDWHVPKPHLKKNDLQLASLKSFAHFSAQLLPNAPRLLQLLMKSRL